MNTYKTMPQSKESEQEQLNRLLLENVQPFPVKPERRLSLRDTLMARVSESLADENALQTVRGKDGVWRILKAGIRYKQLWAGLQGSSVLIEFAPGASLYAHRHNWLEEGIVLSGGLQMGELELGRFDYHVSPPGSRHEAIGSRQGGVAYLRGTSLGENAGVLKELLGGVLHLGKGRSQTMAADSDAGWREFAPGVRRKLLCTDADRASYFYRLQPGAELPTHSHKLEEECLVLEGEAFLGDILLCGGDYQLAPSGTRHRQVGTDVGALLFVRAERDELG